MTDSIIRKPNFAGGGITPDEKRQMSIIADKWIKNAFRTDPVDRDKATSAIEALYEAAGLDKPRVVIVSSPIVMAATYGILSTATSYATAAVTATGNAIDDAIDDATRDAIWNATSYATAAATANATAKATRDATAKATAAAVDDATWDATAAATANATAKATRDATAKATAAAVDDATWDATWNATADAVNDATRDAIADAVADATADAVNDATWDATWNATSIPVINGAMRYCYEISGNAGWEAAKKWRTAYQSGNMWSSTCAYIEAARDVLKLELPAFEKYKAWEDAAIHGGFRILLKDVCLVTDRPEFIKIDADNLSHCENGPSHRWRDGWELYHWHGVSVPKKWIMDPEAVTPDEVLSTENVEKRAAGISIIGMSRLLNQLPHEIIDSEENPEHGDLIKVKIPDLPDPVFYLKAHCPRNGWIMEAVNHQEMDELTVRGAQAWRVGIPASEFIYPALRT